MISAAADGVRRAVSRMESRTSGCPSYASVKDAQARLARTDATPGSCRSATSVCAKSSASDKIRNRSRLSNSWTISTHAMVSEEAPFLESVRGSAAEAAISDSDFTQPLNFAPNSVLRHGPQMRCDLSGVATARQSMSPASFHRTLLSHRRPSSPSHRCGRRLRCCNQALCLSACGRLAKNAGGTRRDQ